MTEEKRFQWQAWASSTGRVYNTGDLIDNKRKIKIAENISEDWGNIICQLLNLCDNITFNK